VQIDEQSFAGDSGEGDIDCIGKSGCVAAVDHDGVAEFIQSGFEEISELGDMLLSAVSFCVPELQSGGHAGGEGHRFGAGTPAGFLVPAHEQGWEANAALYEECSDAPWAVKLMCAEGDCSGLGLAEGEVDFPDGLNGIEQEWDAVGAAEFREGGGVLNDACFVMSEDDGGEPEFGPGEFFEGVVIEESVGVDGDVVEFESVAGGAEAGFACGGVFTGRECDGATAAGGESGDGGVDGFCTAAGEDDFGGVCIEDGGDLFAAVFEEGAGGASEGVLAAGVGEAGLPAAMHHIQHSGIDRCCGVIIEVDGLGGHWGLRHGGSHAGPEWEGDGVQDSSSRSVRTRTWRAPSIWVI
jgi:hypothetical protein